MCTSGPARGGGQHRLRDAVSDGGASLPPVIRTRQQTGGAAGRGLVRGAGAARRPGCAGPAGGSHAAAVGARAPVNSLPRGQLVHGPWGGSLGERRRPDRGADMGGKLGNSRTVLGLFLRVKREDFAHVGATDSVLRVCTSSVIPLTLRPAQIDFTQGGVICHILTSETRRGSLPPRSLSPWVAPPRFITWSAGRDGVIPPPSVSQPPPPAFLLFPWLS